MLDVPPGSALEAAIGVANLTALEDAAQPTRAAGLGWAGEQLMAVNNYIMAGTLTVAAGATAR